MTEWTCPDCVASYQYETAADPARHHPTHAHPRPVTSRISHPHLSSTEQRRLIELLCLGIERGEKQSTAVDRVPELSVHADSIEGDEQWRR